MAGDEITEEEARSIGFQSSAGVRPASDEQLEHIKSSVDLTVAYGAGADAARVQQGLSVDPGGDASKPKA